VKRLCKLLTLLLAPLGFQTASLAAEQRPNVIFIVVDDLAALVSGLIKQTPPCPFGTR